MLGHGYLCPTHNILGSTKLVVSTLVPPGAVIPSNGRDRMDVLTPRDVEVVDVRDRQEPVFTGNVDLGRLEEVLEGGEVTIIDLQAFAYRQHPVSIRTVRALR